MTFEATNTTVKDTVQSTSNAAASFIETLNRKASSSGNNILSPRTDDNETNFFTPSALEGNIRVQRANSIVAGASPFASTSSLWTASTSLDSLTDNIQLSNHQESTTSASVSGSLWETPRRSSTSGLANWKCVGSAASMLQDSTGRLQDLLAEDDPAASTSSLPRPRATSVVLDRLSFNAASEHPASSSSRPSTPSLDSSRGGHFMQIPALLHEEIGIESAEEAAEIFKRSSMDSLLDFDPSSLFASLTNTGASLDLKSSLLMSAVSPTTSNSSSSGDFRRHSFNWLSSNGGNHHEAFVPANFSNVKTIAEVSSYQSSNAGGSPILNNASATSSYSSSVTSSPISMDTFQEEFIFAPSSSMAQFSKKRFARRHSIAADGVAALEDSFAQSLSFGNPADAAEFFPSSHYMNSNNSNGNSHHNHSHHMAHHTSIAHHSSSSIYYNNLANVEEYHPIISGNIYAAYAGLLGEDFDPESSGTEIFSSNGNNSDELNTFLNSMRSGVSTSASTNILFNHQMPVSYTPAQAGINPTVLSFPNATFHLPTHKGPLYLIEFKSGRTELFFTVDLDTALKVKIDDLVIVEADRGEDFGRITGEISIVKFRQLISQVSQDSHVTSSSSQQNPYSHPHPQHHAHDDVYGSNGNVNHNLAGLKETEIAALVASKEIHPKRIHRHATPVDMKFLQAKAQEEAYAMSRCQSRIRQKKLPMEVVDAEYQWDRNKLTFYFSADRRIDFRELVRDLFRIYKTRIWMCAVDKNRAILLNSLTSSST